MRFKLLIFILAAALCASAAPITGTVDATFINPPSNNGVTDGGLTFQWSDGSGTPSWLKVTEPTINTQTGLDFIATRLSFYNGRSDPAESVDLQISLSFTAPPGWAPEDLVWNLSITGNSGNGTDFVGLGLPASFDPRTFTLGGTTYTLVVDGFYATNDSHRDHKLSSFDARGGDTESVNLWMRVDAAAAQQSTPEPGTISLAVLGLGVLVAARKFRRAH